MSRPKLTLDTNTCGRLVDGYAELLPSFRAAVKKNYRLFVTPLTLIELLRCFQNGSEEHFANDQQRIRAAVGAGSLTTLSFPGTFALGTALGLTPTINVLGGNEFKRWVQAVLHAQCSSDLLGGKVKLPNDRGRRRWGLDFNILNRQHDETVKHYIEVLKQVQESKGVLPPRQRWARNLAKSLGFEIEDQEAQNLADALDAAYMRLSRDCQDAKSQQYKPAKHESNCVDYECLATTTFTHQRQLFLPTDDNYNLCKLTRIV